MVNQIKCKAALHFNEKPQLEPDSIPRHIAIVMDGNRRWAKAHDFGYDTGHRQGAKRVDEMVEAAIDLGVQTVTLYAFSTENKLRGKAEIAVLMTLLEKYLTDSVPQMVVQGVRLSVIGNVKNFSKHIQKNLEEACKATKDGSKLDLVLALNYGARDEICRAAMRFARDCCLQKCSSEKLTEEQFADYLDTAPWPDPELLIRTGGEMRLSNFLLWQISYSEVYITKTLWPDFGKGDLLKAIMDYQSRKRRFGK